MAPFKGTLASDEAGRFVAEGILGVRPDARVTVLPVADGGEGTLDAVRSAMKCRIEEAAVEDPLGRPLSAAFGMAGHAAIIEMAKASGLPLLSENERNPLAASSRGTGMLAARAIDAGAERITIGAGGSATVDGGTGAMSALGFRFLDRRGRRLGPGGGPLRRLRRVEFPAGRSPVKKASFVIACDVTNPLVGPDGAARVYGPQKGASAEDIAVLEEGLARLAEAAVEAGLTDVLSVPMAGAAGGLAGGFAAFLGARLIPGGEWVLDAVRFDEAIEGADLVVTGEGRIDFQSAFGKMPSRVAARAKRKGVRCVAVGGTLDRGFEDILSAGVEKAFAAWHRGGRTAAELRKGTPERLRKAGAAIAMEFLGEGK